MQATQQIEFWKRYADYLDNEAVHARYRFDDEATAKIYDSGADRAREMVERWRRTINGGK